MQKKGISVLLSFCVLFIYVGSINAINKGGENATSRNEQIESDRLPIADPYVMLYNNKYYCRASHMVPVVQQQVKASPASPPMI